MPSRTSPSQPASAIPARRRRVAVTLTMAGAAIVSLVTVLGHDMPRAAAAGSNAGSATVITPATASPPLAPLSTGGSATPFTLKLPDAAACTGDSANANYRVQSYMVPVSVDPGTLTFNSAGPVQAAGQFRAPLYDTFGSPYVNKQTASAVPAGGPGPVLQPLPAFDYKVYVPGDIPAGTYNIGIACTLGGVSVTQQDKYWNLQVAFVANLADVPAQITWTVVPLPATPTTTTLSVTPATSATVGATATLAATVSPAVAGTVTFKDGATTIGAPVTVTTGSATLPTSSLALGTHSLTASFTPSAPASFAPSTSAAVSYTITAPATATTTTLSVTPATGALAGASVTLTATVAPAVAGTVTFNDGATALGGPVTVTAGTATFQTTSLAPGAHSLTASFTASAPASFAPSTSAAVSYTITSLAATTTTGLSVSPALSAAVGAQVTLTAIVAPVAAGTVTFNDGATALGGPVTVTGGTATFQTTSLALGAHSLSASFTPSAPGSFTASTSAAVSYTIVPSGPTFAPLSPVRVWDSRFGPGPVGQIGPAGGRDVTVTGVGGVPATGVTAVVLNVTAVDASAGTFVTAWPTGEVKPLASNLNVPPGDTRPNLVIVKVGASGQVSFYNDAGTVDLIADVAGWYGASGGQRYTGVSPARVWDSRFGPGPTGRIGTAGTRDITVTGIGGVPASGVTAVVLNVTAVNASAGTFVTAWPTGEARPLASNLNVPPGDTRPNLVIVKVGAGGKVSFYNDAGDVDLIADVAGWYGTTGASLSSVSPARVWDSRFGPGPTGRIGAAGTRDVTVTGIGGVPATGVTAVVLNVTAVNPTAGTFVTAWPTGEAKPLASNVNVPPGDTRPNLVIVKVGAGGKVSFNNDAGDVDLIADVAGWYGTPGT